ncbi:hypothetical protein TL16_g02916 [Triparma laevis f. inornata]|uniref:monogalactosyldiacylglycerol synthase n=1 Tax=Triparma laevis f. inornata TaxID=1714386 RepID=A0A9W6ZXQ0_9STRA|nr:hypothetical protein TL16_g02916 [Triparma laevis f. inornata]
MAILSLGDTLHVQLKSYFFTISALLYSLYFLLKNLRPRVKVSSLGGLSYIREQHRVLANWALRVILHGTILVYNEELKTQRIDTILFVPAEGFSAVIFQHLPLSVQAFKVVVPKILAANLAAILLANSMVWFGKYILLVIKVLSYVFSVRKAGAPVFEDPPQRVLIVHGSVGAGHKRAAQALSDTFQQRYPEIVVEVVDIVDFAGSFFSSVYKTGYLSLSEKTWGSHLVGYFFDAGNTERPGWFKRLIQEAFLLDFINYIYKFKPDVIVNTHFLSTEIVAGLRRRQLLKIPQVTVVTDYDAHAYWANYPNEKFFVGQEGAVGNLTHVNPQIEQDDVLVTGIPCVPAFSAVPTQKQCIKNLGLAGEKGRPIVLICASGAIYEGRPSVFTLYEQALSCSSKLEIVIITGRQKDLRSQLEQIAVRPQHKVKLEGFTKVMHEYMTAADLIITKPGGLTTAESLATGTAMLIVNPYPGQEMRNTDNLLEAGIAVKCNDLYLLGNKLQKIVEDPKRLKDMQKKSKAYGNAGACFDIVDYIADGEYGYIDVFTGTKDEEREIHPENKYNIHQTLGQGAFGVVVLATVKSHEELHPEHETKSRKKQKAEKAKAGHALHHDPQQFAIKYLKIDNATTATEGIMEATKLVKVSHPNIVTLREQFFKDRSHELSIAERLVNKGPAYDLCLVMERCDGDLQHLIRSWAGSEEQQWGADPGVPEKLRILAQITAAVAHIHEVQPCALIHRDLKPENVFIAHIEHPETENLHLHVKIGDMGLSDDKDDDNKGFAGTPGYIAPELYQWFDGEVEDYDELCDVWSIGMICLDLLCVDAFDAADGASAAYQMLTESNDVETDEETDEFDASVVFLREGARSVLKAILKHEDAVGAGKPTMNLLKKFLVVDPAKRSTARELLESSPLSDVEPKEDYMDSW